MLSEKMKKMIDEVIKKYPSRRSAVMPALMIAQKEGTGHVTKDDMEEIAEILDLKPVVVAEIGGFYTMYNVQRPVGKYHVQVCRNISCSLLGAEHIISHIEKKLGIKTGDTTRDKKFTVSTVECLGSCGTAPMMQINDDYYENLTNQGVDEILDSLK